MIIVMLKVSESLFPINHPATDGEDGEKVAGFRKLMEIQSSSSFPCFRTFTGIKEKPLLVQSPR